MNAVTRVLGVDTSLRSTGFGIVEARGTRMVAIEYGTIRNAASLLHSECLSNIQEELLDRIARNSPVAAAIEGIFHCKNVKTAVALGQARGVVMVVCASRRLPVYEYAPRRVKQAVVGHGGAHKQQVAAMVSKILNLAETPQEDAADALALALCHLHNHSLYKDLHPKMI